MANFQENIDKIYNSKFFDTTMVAMSGLFFFTLNEFNSADIYSPVSANKQTGDFCWRFKSLEGIKFSSANLEYNPKEPIPITVSDGNHEAAGREFSIEFFEDDNLTVFKTFSALNRVFSNGKGLISDHSLKDENGNEVAGSPQFGFHTVLSLYKANTTMKDVTDTFNADNSNLPILSAKLYLGTVLVKKVNPPFTRLDTSGTPSVPVTKIDCIAAKGLLNFDTGVADYKAFTDLGNSDTSILLFGRAGDKKC